MAGNATDTEYSRFVDTIQLLSYWLQYPAFTVNLILIFLSFHYVKPCLARTFVLHISIPSFFCSSYRILRYIFREQITNLYDNLTVHLLDYLAHTMALFPAITLYEIQATLIVLLTYFCYSHPLKYRKIFSPRKIFATFLIGDFFALLAAINVFFERTYLHFNYNTVILKAQIIVRLTVTYGLLILMFVFYFKILHAIVIKSKNQPNNSDRERRNRTNLRAVLIYCTPPNAFLVLSAGGTLSSAFVNWNSTTSHDKFVAEQTLFYKFTIISLNTVMLRLFVNSLCALFAFHQYREAVKMSVRDVKLALGNVFFRKATIGDAAFWRTNTSE
ncbi:hypothetical protein QR680_006186 [Steinernema hermaphroditum]|uniref:Uncharacterized protein n=1 Tax=Steinernema hermaphroditum TaxID=289476 RepID=A0AA39HUL1_9BILA|nr:hypothetical protein QR680_006186 [Steinernema hermaphroditum]